MSDSPSPRSPRKDDKDKDKDKEREKDKTDGDPTDRSSPSKRRKERDGDTAGDKPKKSKTKKEKHKDKEPEEEEEVGAGDENVFSLQDVHIVELDPKKCPITSVTVYNDRAEIIRNVSVEIQTGDSQIVLSGLSAKIDLNSIRVAGGTAGDFTILEVSGNLTYTKQTEETESTRANSLIKEFEDIQLQYQNNKKQLERIDKEFGLLSSWASSIMAMHSPSSDEGSQNKFFSDQISQKISDFFVYYRKKLEDIDERRNKLQYENEELEKKASQLMEEINSVAPLAIQHIQDFWSLQPVLNDQQDFSFNRSPDVQVKTKKRMINLEQVALKPTPKTVQSKPKKAVVEVVIVVHASKQAMLNLNVAYVVMNSTWQALYDIRVKSGESKLDLHYYGNIFNNTDEDWNDVSLCLSTAQPSVAGTPPELKTKIVTLKSVDYRMYKSYDDSNRINNKAHRREMKEQIYTKSASYDFMETEQQMPYYDTPVQETMTVKDTATSSLFSIKRKATILSDNKSHKVAVTVLSFEAEFKYIIIPKSSQYAYLGAEILNCEKKFPILAGEINVFMDGNFIARSDIGTVHPNEKFSVYLGTDASVKFEYQPLKQLKDTKGVISKTNTLKVKFNTKIHNTKSKDIKVVLIDSLPKSNDSSILVELVVPQIEPNNNAISISNSSIIHWKQIVKAGAKIEIPFQYNIEYPSSKEIENAV